MARLTAITLAFAILVDFFFLPPLLIFLDRVKTMKSNALTSASLTLLFSLAAMLLVMQSPKSANASNEKGIAIATEVDNRDKGWRDVTVEGKMTLKNKAGKESIRQFRSKILEASSWRGGPVNHYVFKTTRCKGYSFADAFQD